MKQTRKPDRRVYLRAAEIVETSAHSNTLTGELRHTYCCDAIGDALPSVGRRVKYWATTEHVFFATIFDPKNDTLGWFGDVYCEANRPVRVLALCFAAAMAKDAALFNETEVSL